MAAILSNYYLVVLSDRYHGYEMIKFEKEVLDDNGKVKNDDDDPNNPIMLVAYGNVTGKEGVTDGDNIRTGIITEIKDGVAKTVSGSLYKLEKPNPEYEEYVTVFKESPEKLIRNWVLAASNGGFILVGERVDRKPADGKVVEQNGNWVRFEDGSTNLVVWRYISEITHFNLDVYHEYKGLHKERDFELTLGKMYRPKLVSR